jgi:hypothetical protein
LGIQFGAGGDTAAEDLEATGTSDPSKVVNLAKRFVKDLGVERVMTESGGITRECQELADRCDSEHYSGCAS